MDRFMNPKSVAVIGASEERRKGGYALVSNLKEKFPERLYPVNPSATEICGLPVFKSVQDLPEAVDLAVIFVPAAAVPEVMEACGKKGISRIIIQSAGFAETGPKGTALQEACVRLGKKYHMRVWGPNCMGVINGSTGMVASFMKPDIWRGHLKPGKVSLVVQSGMLSAGFMIQVLKEGFFGLSKACSIGNRCDVDESDLLEYFAEDRETEVIAMYLESIIDVSRFRTVMSRLGKPVVILKGGMSEEGARAARSHTGSLAGDGRLTEGFLRQMKIHRAADFFEMVDMARGLSLWQGRAGGRRIGIVTFSGASGIVASDHFAVLGMTLAPLSQETLRTLQTVFPPWMSPQNPVDVWPAIERVGQKAFEVAIQAILADSQVDALYLHLYVDREILDQGVGFLDTLKGSKKPTAIWLIGDPLCFREVRDLVEPFGTPVFAELARGARVLSAKLASPHS
jgi:acetate---CoA ligase (ADP-forming)